MRKDGVLVEKSGYKVVKVLPVGEHEVELMSAFGDCSVVIDTKYVEDETVVMPEDDRPFCVFKSTRKGLWEAEELLDRLLLIDYSVFELHHCEYKAHEGKICNMLEVSCRFTNSDYALEITLGMEVVSGIVPGVTEIHEDF